MWISHFKECIVLILHNYHFKRVLKVLFNKRQNWSQKNPKGKLFHLSLGTTILTRPLMIKEKEKPMKSLQIIALLLTLALTANASIPDDMPEAVYNQIVQQVIDDTGYYDSIAVQEGVSQWLLLQPLDATDGELIDSGNCETCQADDQGSDAQFNQPRNVKIKAKLRPDGKFPSVLKIKWKRPQELDQSIRDAYQVSHYLIHISKDNESYEVLRKNAKYKNNGKLKKKQKIKFKDRDTGAYTVQVQAVYVVTSTNKMASKSTSKSTNKAGASESGSLWTGIVNFETSKDPTTVDQITDALHTCLIANGFTDTTLLLDVDPIIDCSNQNLTNTDIVNMGYLSNIRSINISDNQAVTDISELANLVYLEYLVLSNNPNITLPDFGKFDGLKNLYLSNMGLTSVPDLSTNDSLEVLDLRENSISSGYDLIPESVTTISVGNSLPGSNNTTYCQDLIAQGLESTESLEIDGVSNINLADCSAISGLKNLNVINSLFDTAIQDVSTFIDNDHLCSLGIKFSNVEYITGMESETIEYAFNLDMNSNLKYVEPPIDSSNNVLRIAQITNIMENQEGLLCSNRFKLAEADMFNNKNTSSQPQSSTTTNSTGGVGYCGLVIAVTEYNIPDTCKPDPFQNIEVYQDINTQRRYLTWGKDPAHDFELWEVEHIIIKGFDRLGNLNEEILVPIEDGNSVYSENLNTTRYTISACTIERCGYEIETTSITHSGNPINSFDVYSDTNTQRRYISWQKNDTYDYEFWGVDNFKVIGYVNNEIVYQRRVAIDDDSILINNSFLPDSYTISACSEQECGIPITDSAPFSQGLSRVTNLNVNWLDLQDDIKDFKFSFNYPATNQSIGLSWDRNEYVDVTSNSMLSTGNDGWKSKARPDQKISTEGEIEFTYKGGTSSAIIGLHKYNDYPDFTNMDYRFVFSQSDHSFKIFKKGLTGVAYNGSWSPQDVFKISIIDGNIGYYQNDTLLFSSQLQSSIALKLNGLFYGSGAIVENISLKSNRVNDDPNYQAKKGYPTYFEIHSDFTQENGETLIQTIPQSHGNQLTGWESHIQTYSPSINGNSFYVYACNEVLGCGASSNVLIRNPITSSDLQPPSSVSAVASDSLIKLNWSLSNNTSIDYFEVYEEQPVTMADQEFRPNLNQSHHDKGYYLDISDVVTSTENNFSINLKRQAIGRAYHFIIRSCHRDRINGDVCSVDSEEIEITQNRGDIGTRNPTPVNNAMWYEYTDEGVQKYGLNWDVYSSNPQSYYKPDYFYLTNTSTDMTCEHQELTIAYADKSANDDNWTVMSDCIDVGIDSVWKVQSCINGLGCAQGTEIDLSNINQQLTGSQIEGFLSSPVVGGPGDLMPGMWWNEDLTGTGWHFYWASELRHDSTFNHPGSGSKYGKTYDLVGYWFAFQEINEVWTPVWFEARMKQVIGQPEPNYNHEGYFQGDIFYHNKLADGTIDKIDVGNIKLLFESTNQMAELIIDPDDISIFSQTTNATDIAPYTLSNGAYRLRITDFTIGNIEENSVPEVRFGERNNADHYSGVWEHTDENENTDISVITWIERSLEVTTIATFDIENKPIWMQVESCSATFCNRSSGDYFENYKVNVDQKSVGFVHTGYNPLTGKPEDHDFNADNGAIALSRKGRFGRCYSSGSDRNRFKQGNFWLTFDNPTVLSYENGYNRNVPNFGSQGVCDDESTLDLVKKASLHDIRFFINGQDESVTTCDPNDPDGSGECVIKFTWYTDDFFPSIEPYYSLNGSSYQKLNDICSGVPLENFVVTQFECTISQAGDYTFQLHKDDYTNPLNSIVIAESKEMTIESCNSQLCSIGVVGEPATPPETVTHFAEMNSHPNNDLIGTTSGSFDIDESGNANYSIPIFAPTGAGGLSPQLALNYSSASGNGIAGVGWNISGTSSITRCLTSLEHDPGASFYPAVSMTDADALCMDGQRLFKDADGNYRTEIDSFNKIIPVASNATGPTSFIVYTKSGEIREYGSSDVAYKKAMVVDGISQTGTGAQILANDDSGAIHTWLLNKIEDRNGNSMHFVWSTYQGESYLAQVKWTNPASDPGATQTHHYQIDFNYNPSRTDAMHHYGIGTEYKAYRSLKHISTSIRPTPSSAGMQEVRRLNLTYQANANATGLLRLEKIEQCLNAGTCLQPIKFQWDNGSTQVGLSSSVNSSTDIGEFIEMGYGSYKPIDVNGDGQMELIFIRGYDDGYFIFEDLEARYWVAYHTNTGQAPIGVRDCTSVGGYYNYICDTGIEPFDAESGDADNFTGEKWFVLDYNGDGKQDILTPIDNLSGNWQVILSDGNQIHDHRIDTGIPFYNRHSGSTLLDYTGDGLPDLLTIGLDNSSGADLYKYKLYPMVKSGLSYVFSTNSANAKFVDIDTQPLHPIDMICNERPDGTGIPCMYDFLASQFFGRIIANKLEPVVTDFNGDGYNDAIYSYTYRYSEETCGIGTWPPHDPERISASIPSGEYTTDAIETSTNLINGLPQPIQHCQQKFKAIMLTGKNANGSLKYSYGGRLGIVKNDFNDYSPPVIRCNEGTGNACRGKISNNIGATQVTDINGDGLADFKFHSTNGDYRYRLNQGKSNTVNVDALTVGNLVIQEAYQYKEPLFSADYNIGLPLISEKCNTHSNDPNQITNDSCARRLLTQFLDYDMDGDIDVLYSESESNSATTSVKYLLKKFNSQTNLFENTTIPSTNQIVSYNKSNKAKDYSNSIFDLNGDGNYDLFSLYRKDLTHKSKYVKLGANGNKPKNKITKITNVVGNKQTSIDITYESATNPDVYTKGTGGLEQDYGEGSPVFDILAPMYLVKSVTKNASGYAPTSMDYHYSGLKVQGGGRGSLGFATITSTDVEHKMTTETSYRQDFPFIGMPESTMTIYSGGPTSEIVSESYSFYDAKISIVDEHTTYFPYLKRSFEQNHALNTTANGLLVGNVTKTMMAEFSYNNSSYPNYGDLVNSDIYTCTGDTQMPLITAAIDSVCSQANNKLITQKSTTNSYDSAAHWLDDWMLARLSATTVTSKRKVATNTYDSKLKSSDFSYYEATGQLKQEHITGGVKIIHEYDSYGQETKTYQCTSDITNCQSVPTIARQQNANTIHRYKESVYGDGMTLWPEYIVEIKEPFVSALGINFITQSTQTTNNLVGGSTTLRVTSTIDSYDIYGNPTRAYDVFGNYSETAYGHMGKAHATANNSGSFTTTTEKWCSQVSYCPTKASISIEVQTLGAPTSRKYLDVMGRELQAQTQTLKGEWTTVDTSYDHLGRTYMQSEPYIRNVNNTPAITPTYTTTTYDDLDRIDTIVSPSRCIEELNSAGSCVTQDIITTTTYTNLAVTKTNPKLQSTTQYFDESGKVIQSTDSAGDSVYYTYDAHDNLKVTSSTDINGGAINIVMNYDNFGRKTSMTDPDKGSWSYTYNELGEMLTQTNANGRQTNYYFDIRGRKYLQTADDVRSIWEYDVGANYGLLVNEFSIGRGNQAIANNPTQGVAQIKSYSFDEFHRPQSTQVTVYDGEGDNSPHNYTTSQTYDEHGRIFQSFDATDNGVLFQYNNFGYHTITRDAADGLLGQIYHEVLNSDARGQVLKERFYNKFETVKTYENSTGFVQTIVTKNETDDEVQNQSFAFDEVGNLIRRTDNNPVIVGSPDVYTENFDYDTRNRLTHEFLNDIASKTYQYDKTGNILVVNDEDGMHNYLYAQTNNAGPHAVTSAKGNSYEYDSGGNVTSKSGEVSSTFAYTSFDKPHKITAGDWTSEVVYNTSSSRYLRKDIKLTDRTITHYLGSVEYVYKTNGRKTAKRYIGNLIININNDEINHSSWGYSYLLKDHIGSTHKVVNKQGNQITAMSFDAWGARRKSTTPDIFNTPIYKTYDLFGSQGVWARLGRNIDNTTNRGFTGHEHFDQVGIIHMNGRIYDPEIGRFLQADPIIQDPYDTQSLNRYSYVMNNPLSYTDPSGYFRLKKGWFRQLAAIGIMLIPGAQNIGIIFLQGALSGAVATGSLKGALKGGIQAALTYGIAHGSGGDGWIKASKSGGFNYARTIAHGVVGGISAEVDGGKFGHGFASSVLSSGADKLGLSKLNPISRIIANAIVAGTISELTGGKFANGAMSAAFRVAFNDGMEIRFRQQMASKLSEDRGTEFIDEFNSLKVYGGDYEFSLGFDSESLFQAGVGLGDGLTLGFTEWLRGSTGVDGGVDTGSTAYSVGNYSSFGVGAARLTYAGLAKGYTLLPGISAQSAVGFRNGLKTGFRLGVGKNWRSKSYEYFKGLKRPPTDAQIIYKAGHTNSYINAYGAGLIYDGISDDG